MIVTFGFDNFLLLGFFSWLGDDLKLFATLKKKTFTFLIIGLQFINYKYPFKRKANATLFFIFRLVIHYIKNINLI